MSSITDEAVRVVERAREEGRAMGRNEAAREFFSENAVALLLHIHADALEASGQRVQAFDASAANYLTETARKMRAHATPPRVTSTTPDDAAVAVPVDAAVSALFSREIDPASVTADSFYVGASSGGAHKAASVEVSGDGRIATLTVDEPFTEGVEYRATITADVQAEGDGPHMAEFSWTFTTVETV